MTPERFSQLLEAYGADFRRWPETERAPAHALLAQGSLELRRQMAEAAQLDGLLDSHTVAVPEMQLVERIVADRVAPGAAPGRTAQDARRWRTRWLWPGASLAGIGLAGTLAGAFVVSAALRIAAPPRVTDWPERSTAFSELSADWSEE
jgi:hypothetical protein